MARSSASENGRPDQSHVRTVEQSLDHSEWFATAALPDELQHRRLRRRMASIDDREPHASTALAASSRRNPSSIATATVASKISSSLIPAAFSSAASRSVIV